MIPVFENGFPVKITRNYFRSSFGDSFPSLLDSDKDNFLDEQIDAVYAMFAGVKELWDHLDKDTWFYKTQHCYGLLVAWYIANLFPLYTSGVQMSGGVPILAKSIGGVKLQFAQSKSDKDSVLKSLNSNSFGHMAYIEIRGSGRMFTVFTRSK